MRGCRSFAVGPHAHRFVNWGEVVRRSGSRNDARLSFFESAC